MAPLWVPVGNKRCEQNLAKFPSKRTLVPSGEDANDLLFDRAGTFVGASGESAPARASDCDHVETRMVRVPMVLTGDE
jgi:hypothetical protein